MGSRRPSEKKYLFRAGHGAVIEARKGQKGSLSNRFEFPVPHSAFSDLPLQSLPHTNGLSIEIA